MTEEKTLASQIEMLETRVGALEDKLSSIAESVRASSIFRPTPVVEEPEE